VFWADGSFVVFAVVFAVVDAVVVEDKGAFVLWLVGSRLWLRLPWRPPPPPFFGGISRKIKMFSLTYSVDVEVGVEEKGEKREFSDSKTAKVSENLYRNCIDVDEERNKLELTALKSATDRYLFKERSVISKQLNDCKRTIFILYMKVKQTFC